METSSDEIIYTNTVSYEATNGVNFFTEFGLKCRISQTVDITMLDLDINDGSLVGDIEDDFNLGDYASLVVYGDPEGNLIFAKIKF